MDKKKKVEKKKPKEETRDTKIALFFMSLFMGLILAIFLSTALWFMNIKGAIIATIFFPSWALTTIGGYYIFYPK